MIDPDSHLMLHRIWQQERDRHLGHLAAIRAARDSADAVRPARSGIRRASMAVRADGSGATAPAPDRWGRT